MQRVNSLCTDSRYSHGIMNRSRFFFAGKGHCYFFIIENYKELLATAMEDGFVVATIIKILIIGSPGVGKTGVRQLLLGMPPPAIDAVDPRLLAHWTLRQVSSLQKSILVQDFVS